MYLQQTITKDVTAEAQVLPPFGAGFTAKEADGADKLEVWCTNFNDNEEYVEFRLFKEDRLIRTKRIEGY